MTMYSYEALSFLHKDNIIRRHSLKYFIYYTSNEL